MRIRILCAVGLLLVLLHTAGCGPRKDAAPVLPEVTGSEDAHTDEPTEPKEDDGKAHEIPPAEGVTGDFGRIVIPEGDYSAAVYYSLEDEEAQRIVDAEDSAVASRRDHDETSTLLIADHTNQGFCVLYDVIPGSSAAYLYKPDGAVEEYICTDRFTGHNNLKYLTDEEGNDLSYVPVDIIMYTCNETWENVTITYWEKMDEGADR